MTARRQGVAIAVGAVLAVLLQVMVAPSITLFGAQPNILAVYALVVAVTCPYPAGSPLPFVLGLLYDLLGTGPVGGMALVLVVVSFAASNVLEQIDERTAPLSLLVFLLSVLLVESLYGILLIALGFPVGIGAALVYRALPCTLYDGVVGLLFYPLMARLLRGADRVKEA